MRHKGKKHKKIDIRRKDRVRKVIEVGSKMDKK